MGSVSYRLQYLAELLPACEPQPWPRCTCRESRERLLCSSLPWPSPLCSLGHQPFPPAEAFHCCINGYFKSKRSELFFPRVSLVCTRLLTEMMKITIQIMKFRIGNLTSQGNQIYLIGCLIFFASVSAIFEVF